MDHPKQIAAISLITVGMGAVAVTFRRYHKDLYGRFPDYDRKIVRKAFRRMMWRATTGQYSDAQLASDQSMDWLFLKEYRALTHAV